MKKLITVGLIIGGLGLVAFTLMGNKQEMEERTKLASQVSGVIPVETGVAELKQMNNQVSVVGTFEAFTDLTILSQTSGLVTKVYHDKGDFVKKGVLLAEVENESLKAELEAAEANLEKSKLDKERFENLVEKDAVTQRQLEDVRIAAANAEAQYKTIKKRLDDTYIKATATGTINEDFIQEGSNISSNTKLYDIVDVSKLKLNVKLTAPQILQVKEGDGIRISADLYPGTEFNGVVTAIAAKADAGLKYDLEILVQNDADNPLKAGMFGKAHFNFEKPIEELFINRDALIGSIKNPAVFVVENGKAFEKEIQVGQVYAGELQVLSGLEEGEVIVVNGQINLKNGKEVRDINSVQTSEKPSEVADQNS